MPCSPALRASALKALAAAAVAIPALMPLQASAQQTAYVTNLLNLRAGPSPDFPVVAVLQPGVAVAVQGCTTGYSWCDVAVDGNLRGWVSAAYLSYPSGPQPVPFTSAAIGIGVPIVAFTLGAYWGSYYVDRPWYGRPPVGWGPPPPHRPPGYRPPPVRPPPHVRPPHPGGPGPGMGGGPGPNRPPGGQPGGPHVRPPQGGGQHGGGPGRPPSPGGGGHHGGGGRN